MKIYNPFTITHETRVMLKEGVKRFLLFIWGVVTIALAWAAYRNPTHDWLLIRNACPDAQFIESRAEKIEWGSVSSLVFYCR